MYQSRSFHRGYAAAIAIVNRQTAYKTPEGKACGRAFLLCDLTMAKSKARSCRGAARYYQLGIEAAILDAFGC